MIYFIPVSDSIVYYLFGKSQGVIRTQVTILVMFGVLLLGKCKIDTSGTIFNNFVQLLDFVYDTELCVELLYSRDAL